MKLRSPRIELQFTTIICRQKMATKRMRSQRRKSLKRAVPPVLATVILIAITLIVAVAIAGIFGLFGAFTSTAQISITSVSCSAQKNLCILVLTNSGTASTQSGTSGTITFAGQTFIMTCGSATTSSPVTSATVLIPAGGSSQIICSFASSGNQPQPGQQFVGTVSLANGVEVEFSGTFGSFASTAQVSITSVSCDTSGLCTFTLTNSGTESTYSGTSGTITFGGQTVTMTCGTSSAGSTAVLIPAGGSTKIICSFSGSPQAGQQFVGTVSLANGGEVQFSGTFGINNSTAQISITSVSCSASQKLCTLTLTNSGTESTYSGMSGTITFGGQTYTMQCGPTTSGTTAVPGTTAITAGKSQLIYCSWSSGSAQPGQQFVGTVSLANGGQAQFSGTFGQ
jgi:flagellin-like protein